MVTCDMCLTHSCCHGNYCCGPYHDISCSLVTCSVLDLIYFCVNEDPDALFVHLLTLGPERHAEL